MVPLFRALRFGLLGIFLTTALAVAAETYPAKPIRVIVPFPPGGPADGLARIIGEKLGTSLGAPVVVENHPGAAGNIGMGIGAKAAPDGYTFVLAPAGNLTVNPFLYRSMPYDVGRDFAPITVLATVPNILVVNPSLPVKSIAELVTYAKAHRGELNFSSPGNGSGAHLAAELLKSMAGIDMTHIPFNGIAPAVTAVLGEQVQLMFAGAPSVLQHVRTGKLRALGVASLQRISAAPDLPTLAESGFPGFEVTSWYGIVAPAGTPTAIITRMSEETAKALKESDVREKLAALGAEPVGNTPAEFAAMIKSETVKWGKIVKEAHITAE